jgi:hypothetical protein
MPNEIINGKWHQWEILKDIPKNTLTN